MEDELLLIANDELEAYLVETILRRNEIPCVITMLAGEEKKRVKRVPDRANILVSKENFSKAMKLVEDIRKDREVKRENQDEDRIYTKKQLTFAISISIIFLLVVIIIVTGVMK